MHYVLVLALLVGGCAYAGVGAHFGDGLYSATGRTEADCLITLGVLRGRPIRVTYLHCPTVEPVCYCAGRVP